MQCFDQLDKISKMERTQFLCNDCGKDFVDDVKLKLYKYAMHTEIKPSQMEVAPLHRTFVISHKRRLFKNTKGI